MTINKFNYEAFALDYLEGNLAPEMAEEMERFLKTHPAIEAELSGMMEFVVLEPDTSIVFENKAALLKPEKVVWLSKKWVRPLMAAASVLLLLMTYIVGYQAGTNNGTTQVVVEKKKTVETEPTETIAITEKEVLPSREAVKTETSTPIISKNTIEQEVVAIPKKKEIVKELLEESKIAIQNYPLAPIQEKTEVVAQVVDNEPVAKEKRKIHLPVAPLKRGIPKIASNTVQNVIPNTNSLDQALAAELPIDKEWLANTQKKKRSFKDLLGKFPVSNIKEALIPSYYKDENAGQ